jgi:hypothetical protein
MLAPRKAKFTLLTTMPPTFVLELRDVSSLTEARFAAGEGFTHIRLSKNLAEGKESAILDIKNFLSGVAVGLEVEDANSALPAWADYFVLSQNLVEGSQKYPLYALQAVGEASIFLVSDLTQALPTGGFAGISLPGLVEEKTGFADYAPHQDFLELVREAYEL